MQNKNIWAWIVVIVLVLLGLWWWQKNPSMPAENGGTVNENETALESTEDVGPGSINVNAPKAAMTYQQALTKYASARLQLDRDCQGTPDNMTFKNNSNMMVDNRSPNTRTVKVGSTYTIKPWGFKIIKLSSPTLPATWLVDCDKSQNVATILIQK